MIIDTEIEIGDIVYIDGVPSKVTQITIKVIPNEYKVPDVRKTYELNDKSTVYRHNIKTKQEYIDHLKQVIKTLES